MKFFASFSFFRLCCILFFVAVFGGCYGHMSTKDTVYGGFLMDPTPAYQRAKLAEDESKRTDLSIETQRLMVAECIRTHDPEICYRVDSSSGLPGWRTMSPHMMDDRGFYGRGF